MKYIKHFGNHQINEGYSTQIEPIDVSTKDEAMEYVDKLINSKSELSNFNSALWVGEMEENDIKDSASMYDDCVVVGIVEGMFCYAYSKI